MQMIGIGSIQPWQRAVTGCWCQQTSYAAPPNRQQRVKQRHAHRQHGHTQTGHEGSLGVGGDGQRGRVSPSSIPGRQRRRQSVGCRRSAMVRSDRRRQWSRPCAAQSHGRIRIRGGKGRTSPVLKGGVGRNRGSRRSPSPDWISRPPGLPPVRGWSQGVARLWA